MAALGRIVEKQEAIVPRFGQHGGTARRAAADLSAPVAAAAGVEEANGIYGPENSTNSGASRSHQPRDGNDQVFESPILPMLVTSCSLPNGDDPD